MRMLPSLSSTSLAAFRYREYRLFWIAAGFSNIGMWALVYGRLWLMRSLTDSEVMLGVVTAASLGPVLIFSMWGGVVADRVNRLRLVRITRLMFAMLGFLTGILIATDAIEPWHLVLISAGTGVLLAFDIPSRSAMVASIVPAEHLAGAIALYSLVFGAAAIIGPALFAPLVDAWGLEGLFFIISGSYVLTVGTLWLMSTKGHKITGDPGSPWEGLKQGFVYIRGNRPIASLISLGIFGGVVGFSYQTLIPVFTDEIFGGGEKTYGRLLLASGIGGLTATISIAILGPRVKPALYLTFAGTVYGIALVAFSQTEVLLIAALFLGLVGASATIYQTMSQTLVQTLVDPKYRGRVMGVNQFSWGALSLGGLLMGALAQSFGAPFALTLGGIGIASAVLVVGTSILRQLAANPEGDHTTTEPAAD